MAYNTQEERLIVKGSERITRDLQVNHNIYVNLHTAFKKGHWSVEKGTIGAQKRTA